MGHTNLSQQLLELVSCETHLAWLRAPRAFCGAQEGVLKQLLYLHAVIESMIAAGDGADSVHASDEPMQSLLCAIH